MSTYDWYKIIGIDELDDQDLVSKQVDVIFEDQGLKTVLVTKGECISVTIDEVMLSANLNGKNPFEFEDRAIYVDENDVIWWGILVPEDED